MGFIQIRKNESVIFERHLGGVADNDHRRLFALSFIDINWNGIKEIFVCDQDDCEVYQLINGKYIKSSENGIYESYILNQLEATVATIPIGSLLLIFVIILILLILFPRMIEEKMTKRFWLVVFPLFLFMSHLILSDVSFLFIFGYISISMSLLIVIVTSLHNRSA